jgi:hypothetical protein
MGWAARANKTQRQPSGRLKPPLDIFRRAKQRGLELQRLKSRPEALRKELAR